MKTDDHEDHPRYVAYDEIEEGNGGTFRVKWRISTMLLCNGCSFETMLFDGEGKTEWEAETISRDGALHNHSLVLIALMTGYPLPKQPLPIRLKRYSGGGFDR